MLDSFSDILGNNDSVKVTILPTTLSVSQNETPHCKLEMSLCLVNTAVMKNGRVQFVYNSNTSFYEYALLSKKVLQEVRRSGFFSII